MMKLRILMFVLTSIFVSDIANAQDIPDLTSEGSQAPIGNLEQIPMLGHVVYSRQPDAETIAKLKDQGFTMVLSVRYDDEPVGFDARKEVEKHGMAFQQISFYKGSINDTPRAVDPEAIDEISKLLNATAGGKLLLHCESGQRAAGALAAVLYKDHGYTKENAIEYAEKAGMTSTNVAAALDAYFNTLER